MLKNIITKIKSPPVLAGVIPNNVGIKSVRFISSMLMLLAVNISEAQWQNDVRLTNNSAFSNTSFNNAWCVAASGDYVHAVWHDFRDGNIEIYYKRSTDRGSSWGADTRLTNNASPSVNPSISASGSVVHVVWQDSRDTNNEIYYKSSTDWGLNWGTDTRLTSNASSSIDPSVSVSDSFVHIVWWDDRPGHFEIYYKLSTDGGLSWRSDTNITSGSAFACRPSISVSNQDVHVVSYDNPAGNFEIYYKRSTDGGLSWGTVTQLTINSAFSCGPSVSVSGSSVHVLWYDTRDGNNEIYYKRSTDGGLNWEMDTRLTNNSAFSQYPSVAATGSSGVHVVWVDSRDGNTEIYYKRSTDGGTSWEADTWLTSNSAASRYPSVSISGSIVHVVWNDDRDGNAEIYYKRDPTGNPVGIININSTIPEEFSLSQNYPNPFNPITNLEFGILDLGFVALKVYDEIGKEVATLVNEELLPGGYKVKFDGSAFSSGIYFYQLVTGNISMTKKMLLVK